MSLDISLHVNSPKEKDVQEKIYLRENGQNKLVSREEWDSRFPGQEPFVVTEEEDSGEVWWGNITHNLNKMANEVSRDFYLSIWHPEVLKLTKAKEIVPYLVKGLMALESNPAHYKKFNPKNGWGSYEGFLSLLQEYLKACEKYPDARVETDT